MIRRATMVLSATMLSWSGCAPKRADIPVVDVALGDYFFHAPDTIPSGRVAFRLNVKGGHGHVMDLIRLDQGKTLKDLMAAGEGAADSLWAVSVGGGVSGVEAASPTYTLSLKPGRYVMLCYFGDSTHTPHFMKGMIKEVIAVPNAGVLPLPRPDLTVQTVDYSYSYSTPISAGSRTIAVVNASQQPHEMVMKRLKDGASLEQALAREDSTDPKGPSPWEPFGGVGDIPAGDTIMMQHTFKPGHYLVFCFFEVKGDTVGHYGHGMHQIITVD